MEWENDDKTWEPLDLIAKDAPVDCAQYAIDNNLLDCQGWKQFKRLAKQEKLMTRLINQAKLRSYCTTYRYKFGYKVPKDYNKAKEFDRINKNKFW